MTEITIRQDSDTGAFNPDDEQILNYLGLNPRDPKSRAVVAVAQRYSLDPVLKHVIVIPKGGAYITRDGYLHIAHRSGQLDGIVVEEDPHIVDGEWRCRVSVYRKDMRYPFTFPGRYSVQGANRQYAQEMALKVAESHALRRAFDVAGLPSLDEHLADANGGEPAAPVATAADFIESEPEAQEYTQVQPETGEAPSEAQRKRMFALFAETDLPDGRTTEGRETRLAYCSDVVGREVASSNDLTASDVSAVIDALERDGQQEATDPGAPWPTTETEGAEQ